MGDVKGGGTLENKDGRGVEGGKREGGRWDSQGGGTGKNCKKFPNIE